jgi:hypothetical protein
MMNDQNLEAAAVEVIRALNAGSADLISYADGITVLHNHKTGEDFEIVAEVMDYLIANEWIGRVTHQ